MNDNFSLQTRVVRGGFWISLGFASQQGLSVLRTFVLARLLTPEDFGVIGLTVLILFAGNILTELNIGSALIQKPNLSERFKHTAWSFSLLRGIILAAGLIGLSPCIAGMLNYPELERYLRIGSINFLLISIPTVPLSLLMRHLKYKKRVLLDIAREIVTVALSISLALWLRSAWALLLGLLAGQFIVAGGIWFISDYKPLWVFDRKSFAELWKFGIPLYISGLITYLVTRGDDLVVSKLRGISVLGQYQVVFNIAEMLTRGLSDVVARVVFPAYSIIAGEGRDLGDGFSKVWSVLVLLLLPICGIVVVFPSEIINILLGNQWLSAAPALTLLIVGESIRALCVPFGTIILASGNTANLSRIKIIEVIIFGTLIFPLTVRWGIEGAAACLIIVYTFTLSGSIYMANKVSRILRPLISGIGEPLLGTIVIALLAGQIPNPNTWMTIVVVMIWTLIWGIYIALRHGDLLSKIFLSLRQNVAFIQQ
jgi:O-antigen/teichoic acid export membrane protein